MVMGVEGSGKTYWALANEILPALAAGRRVFHNIANFRAEGAFLHNSTFEIFPMVTTNQATGDHIFTPRNPQLSVQGGDLVIFDEMGIAGTETTLGGSAQRRWLEFFKFLAVHRHYTGAPAGSKKIWSTDIIIIGQDQSQFPRQLMLKVRRTVYMTTPPLNFDGFKRRGLADRSVRVLEFQQGKTVNQCQNFAAAVKDYKIRLSSAVWNRYSSYSGGVVGVERQKGISWYRFFGGWLVIPFFVSVAALIYLVPKSIQAFNDIAPDPVVADDEALPPENFAAGLPAAPVAPACRVVLRYRGGDDFCSAELFDKGDTE